MDEIRSATRDDAPRIAYLAGDLGYAIGSGSIRAAIDRLRPEDGAVFVACRGDHLTGWIHVRRSELLQSEPFSEVGGLVVDPTSRGEGIGKELLKRAEQWAADNHLAVVRVRSNVVRSNAHLFYEGRDYGVEKTSYTFIKHLEDRG